MKALLILFNEKSRKNQHSSKDQGTKKKKTSRCNSNSMNINHNIGYMPLCCEIKIDQILINQYLSQENTLINKSHYL